MQIERFDAFHSEGAGAHREHVDGDRLPRSRSSFTAIWIPSIFGFGIYFKLAALLGRSR
jgi:hypothetical protein